MTVEEIHTRKFGNTAIASGFICAQGKRKDGNIFSAKVRFLAGLVKRNRIWATCCYAVDLVQAGPSQPAHQSWDFRNFRSDIHRLLPVYSEIPIQQDNNVIENSCLPYLLFTAVVLCEVHPVEFREGKWTGMKVYFGFTVAGDRSAVDAAKKIVGILDEMGHEVLTRHLCEENAWEADRSISPREVYLRD